MKLGSGVFHLSDATPVHFAAEGEPAARFFLELVERTRGVTLVPNGAGANTIQFELTAREGAFDEEGYSLTVSPERIVVSANHSRGLFYGAVTLWQLATSSASAQMAIPALTIHDAPRFRWRGLMLDSARHYQSPEFIRKLHRYDGVAQAQCPALASDR